jgi:hypothetical protein
MKRTSQQQGRIFTAWVKAFMEAKKEKRSGALFPLQNAPQMKLDLKGEQNGTD